MVGGLAGASPSLTRLSYNGESCNRSRGIGEALNSSREWVSGRGSMLNTLGSVRRRHGTAVDSRKYIRYTGESGGVFC